MFPRRKWAGLVGPPVHGSMYVPAPRGRLCPSSPRPLPSGSASLSEDDNSPGGGGDAQILTPPTSVCVCVGGGVGQIAGPKDRQWFIHYSKDKILPLFSGFKVLHPPGRTCPILYLWLDAFQSQYSRTEGADYEGCEKCGETP